ncbi:tyrosine-type recombinase/integrase [Leadbetterella sp. DM7]|uniref:tyrosine-type recombinase/integrase n=1 Tax=Leadbetterella sp. DM7 TaxID=3235085 RepID=UPI00349EA016
MTYSKKEKITLPTGLMDVHIHDIRRTFGSFQAITGASLQIIGKSLGHKSPLSTQVYARLNLGLVLVSIEKATQVMFG